MRISSNDFLKYFLLAFFIIYFFIGSFVYKDYGITTDEEFQRYSGFFWLEYILGFTPFENLKILVGEKLNSIEGFTLPNPADFPFYGVIFDLPLALIETLLGIEKSKDYFFLRHFFNFGIFFVSSIYFFFILKDRFNNYLIPMFGLFLYVGSPRIFGDSFFNNKDIVFLSLITIAIFYSFKLLNAFNWKNIILFSIFSAIATSSRILGIFLPASIIAIIFFEMLDKKLNFNNLKKIILLILVFFIFLIILWPYLWTNPIINFLNAFSIFSNYIIDIEFLFNGDFISSKSLPLSYLPIWIFISTPIIIIFLFVIGYGLYGKIFSSRLINIENNKDNNLWINNYEKKDFFMFFNLSIILIFLILSDVVLYNGWRQVYFLNVFLIYFATYGIHGLFSNFKFFKKFSKGIYFVISILIINIYVEIYRTHPFQSLYFNKFFTSNANEKFEVDYWGLSGRKFFNEVISLEKKNLINIGVASWIPLERSLALFDLPMKNRFNIVGQDYDKAHYIFSNNITEINKKINNKYEIPNNFIKIGELTIRNSVVYTIYKNKNL